MKKKKILGICGVQRSNSFSSSDFILKQALSAAAEDGAEVDHVRLVDYNILPCEACGRCLSNNHCPLFDRKEDEYIKLYEKCLWADAFIFSSPVYALSLPGIWKNWIDRCNPCTEEDLSYEYYNYDTVPNIKGKAFKGKVAGQIAVAAGLGHEMALASLMPAFTAVKLTIVANMGLSLVEYDSEPGIRNQPWARNIEDAKFAIDMARALGKRVCESVGFSAFHIDNERRDSIIHSPGEDDNRLELDLEDTEGNRVIMEDIAEDVLIIVAGSQKTMENGFLWLNELEKDSGNHKNIRISYLALVGPRPHFITNEFVIGNVLRHTNGASAFVDWELDFAGRVGLDESAENPVIIGIDTMKRKLLFLEELPFTEKSVLIVNEKIDAFRGALK